MHVNPHPDYADREEAGQASDLISACVHCGFCLETCPTYLVTRDERDSPRGRIYLIKQLLETGEASTQTHTHLDRCLSCRSCETACPSGVQYGQLLDIGRGLMEEQVPRPLPSRAFRWLMRRVLTSRKLLGAGLRLGQILRPALPAALKNQVPPHRPAKAVPTASHARKVLLLEGCVQQAATPGTNAAVRRILDRLGIAAHVIARAGCCGAVNYHLGAHSDGLNDMRRNIDAWWPEAEDGAEAIVSSATGCGSMLADYGSLLAHDPGYAQKAKRISEMSRDIGEILLQEDLRPLTIDRPVGRVAVHTPCSMQHAMKLPTLISDLLVKAGFELAATRDSHLCCGSAGTYSILQADMSQRLRADKLIALCADTPDIIATGNVGCQLHLQSEASIPVVHWTELLDPESALKGKTGE